MRVFIDFWKLEIENNFLYVFNSIHKLNFENDFYFLSILSYQTNFLSQKLKKKLFLKIENKRKKKNS